MTISALRERYDTEPFEPFFLVPVPLSMAIAPSGKFVIVAPPEDSFRRALVDDVDRLESAPGDSQEAA